MKNKQWFYVKEWSESARGGASMLHAEYITQNPPKPIGEYSEKQDPDNEWSGVSCFRVEAIAQNDPLYDDLPVYN